MVKTISFISIEPSDPMCVEFTLVEPGEPLGRGHKGLADTPKVVCETHKPGTAGGALRIVSGSTIGRISGRYFFVPFIGSTLSKDDSLRLGNWARAHLNRLEQASTRTSEKPLKVSVLHTSGGRYARIQAGSKDLSIRLSESVPVDSSLRATAAEWHRKAQRFTEMAIAAESASQLV